MREHFSKDNGYHDDRKNRGHEECQQRLDRLRRQVGQYRVGKKEAEEIAEAKISENESLRLRLFHSLKEAKKYDEAEKLYHVTAMGRDPTKSNDTAMLDLDQSFAAMLVEQRKFQEAEPISRAVWENRKQFPGPPSEIFKESHRQLCSILCAVGKHRDAETMHRDTYQRDPMDAWALENGDEVCQRREEQGEIKRAKEMQDEVWEKRLRLNGPRDGCTIRSGLRLVRLLEKLVKTIEDQGSTEAERRLNLSHKQTFKCEIEMILREIWDTRPQSEPSTDILNAGHKLGLVLLSQNKFPDAEAVFIPVWEGKKRQLGDRDISTMSTGSQLGKALIWQRKRETYLRAVNILQSVWPVWQTVMNGYDDALSSGEDLAHAYHSLEDWPNAERIYTWILRHKAHKPCTTREIDDIRWELGQTLYNQGVAKYHETEGVLGDLYPQWNASSPNSNRTLQCGQMLAQLISTQNGRSSDALKFARDAFNGRGALAQRGVPYLESGHLYGSLLLKVENFAEAERILESAWESQAEGTEEQKMRLKCGHLYGQALAKRHKYPDARRILDAVSAGQGAILPTGVTEIAETRQLLEDVDRLEKKDKRGKRNSTSHRRRGFKIFVTN